MTHVFLNVLTGRYVKDGRIHVMEMGRDEFHEYFVCIWIRISPRTWWILYVAMEKRAVTCFGWGFFLVCWAARHHAC